MFLNRIDTSPVRIEVERIAGPISDKRAGHERLSAQLGPGLGKDTANRCIVEEVDVSGVHVDGGGQARTGSPPKMGAKAVPIHFARTIEGQQDGGHSDDPAARPEHEERIDRHGTG